MATFKLRANELSGQTGLTVRIYALGSDTIANGAGGDALTETASSDGQFTATIAEDLSGQHEYYVYKSGSPIYRGLVNADGAVLIADEPTIDPSEPGKRTGYYTCFDENGVVESGVVVTCWAVQPPSTTGIALDSRERTETSAANGVVEFTNLVVGARYRFKRGDWDKSVLVEVPSGTGAFAMDSLIGRETA